MAAVLTLVAVAPPALAQTTGAAGGPCVPTPPAIVERMLALADVGPNDYLIDLGSGDGRLAIAAVAKRRARGAAGIEIDAGLVRKATFDTDLSIGTVFALYISPGAMQRLKPRFLKLEPGTRIVSHQFGLWDWEPDERIEVDSTGNPVAWSATRRQG